MLLNNEIKKEVLKDSIRNYERLEQLKAINKDDIKSIHITLNVDNGDRLEIINIKPMLARYEILPTYFDIKETSQIILNTTSAFLKEE